ncbi:MATE family efflux transporter [Photobacterium swingsii]|uniref:MATE family efflux transporter n=1 Tax=Photobacterium swingsii TaxID=680026 RepID=UPI00352CA8F4
MHKYKRETRRLLKLTIPVLLASVAQTSMGFIDTVMAGSVSATDMAAVSVASSIWLPSILFGVGLLVALVPIVAQLNGSGKKERIPFEVQHGFYLALLISIPIMLILYNAGTLIDHMDVETILAEKTNGYMFAVMFAVPGFLMFQTLKSFTEGLSLTIPGMIIGFIGLAANIPLNWIFVNGKFGAPALGGVGCGVATAIVYWLMFIAMLVYIKFNKRLQQANLFQTWHKLELRALTRLFKMGFPVAASMFFEISLFAVVAIMIAPLGAVMVASHQVAMNFSSLVFMLPMSLGAAVSIRVGHQLGEENLLGAKVSSYCGLATAFVMAVSTAILTVVFREQIIAIYSDNADVILVASQLLLLAAVYQCTDAIQIVAAGALRGYKDMRAIFVRTFIAYWLIGLPLGYTLGMTNLITEPMGPHGFWIGIIFGLTSSAIMLGTRLRWLQRQPEAHQLEMATR